MRRITTVAVMIAVCVAGAGVPAQAATQTATSSFTLAGSSAEKVFFDQLLHCDECAPDDLFECDGCEITAGVRLRPSAQLSMTAPAEIESEWNDAGFHQGSPASVKNTADTDAGEVKLTYSLFYQIGLFGKGGAFPSDWTATSEYIVEGTESKTLTNTCTLPLSGTTVCEADVSVPIVDEECFGPLCAVDITVSVILEHDITVGPSGIIAQRVSTFQTPGSLTLNDSTQTDTFSVPCSAAAGSGVSYTLGGFSTPATPFDVSGKVKLGLDIDGPGPANYVDTIDLFSIANILDGTITLSNGLTNALNLGTVATDNSAPDLSDLLVGADIDEGGTIAVSAEVDDNCLASASINWGDGTATQNIAGTGTHLDVAGSHAYGDDGTFTITVCGKDGFGTDCVGTNRTVSNVAPATAIDGPATVLARAGDTLTFTTQTTDPGSDDITHTWDFGDGSAPVSTVSLVNPPLIDLDPSTSVQPRAISDTQSHLYGDACTYSLSVAASDDDSGSTFDSVDIVITGNATERYGSGWWYQRFTETAGVFSPARLECYLNMVGNWSTVFDELADASTIAKAAVVLDPNVPAQTTRQFDRQLLGAWLNIANGGLTFDTMVDTNKDKVADTTVEQILTQAEAARHAPNASANSLKSWKDLLDKINLGQL